MKNILILCTGNSCRSQMAHGYLVKLLHKEASIYSAGIEKHGLNPYAVSVMKMDGINISGNSSNLVDEYISIEFDYIITNKNPISGFRVKEHYHLVVSSFFWCC